MGSAEISAGSLHPVCGARYNSRHSFRAVSFRETPDDSIREKIMHNNRKMIQKQFVETLRSHRNVILICLAVAVAVIGCLLLLVLSPARTDTVQAAENPDVPVGGGGTVIKEQIPPDGQAVNEEMDRRMQEIYEYLVQLDSMVTDNQTTLEQVRLQADASAEDDEAMGEVQERLHGDVVSLGERLTTLHEEITSTRDLITRMQEETRKGQTSGLEATMHSFAEVEASISRIGQEFNAAIEDVSSLIDRLRGEQRSGSQEMIRSLENMKSSMQQAQTQNFDDLNRQIADMRENYMNALQQLGQTMSGEISDLNAEMGRQFETSSASISSNVDTRISELDDSLDNKLNGLNNSINEKLEQQSGELSQQLTQINDTRSEISSLSAYLTRIIGDSADEATIIELLRQYKDRVDESFTSVSNGKKLLASALLTKGSDVGGNISGNEDIQDKADSIPFQTYYDAILALEQNYQVESGAVASSVRITAHFHAAGEEETIREFDSFDAYREYLAAHSGGYGTAGSAGGCYRTSVHVDHVYTGSQKCGNWRPYDGGDPGPGGGYVKFRCDHCGAETVQWTASDGSGNGWGIGDHMVASYSDVARDYYDLDCPYQQGQILAIELVY